MRIGVKGTIVSNDEKWYYDWLDYDSTSPKDIEEALVKANGDRVIVEINSGGGSVFAGSEIYTLLRNYSPRVSVEIVGLAASAASVVAMAGEKVSISPTAMLMIHNASSRRGGDKNDMYEEAELLNKVDKAISKSYQLKTHKSEEELLDLMNKETWMNADEAKEHGFVDEVLFETPTFTNDVGFILPENVKTKIAMEKQAYRELELENERLRIKLLKGN